MFQFAGNATPKSMQREVKVMRFPSILKLAGLFLSKKKNLVFRISKLKLRGGEIRDENLKLYNTYMLISS